MRIEYCPNCGEPDPEQDVDRDLSCPNCDWCYGSKEYRRFGTHPKQFDRYCEACVTVYQTKEKAQNHLCTAVELVEEYGSWPLEGLKDALSTHHGENRANRKVRRAVKNNEIVFLPDLNTVTRWSKEDEDSPKLCTVIIDELCEWSQHNNGKLDLIELQERLGAENTLHVDSIKGCVQYLDRHHDAFVWGRKGIYLSPEK